MQEWFRGAFAAPTAAQARGWPPILDGRSTLLLAPTGSGKTLAAFLAAIDRLMFTPEPPARGRCRVLYVSPLKALAVDVERNLRAPVAGIAAIAERRGEAYRLPSIAIRSGDTPASERARISRTPPDVLITTPESLYLLLTSQAREGLASVETVIVDEIHAIAASKRGAHLFLSLERLEALRPEGRGLQRIGLSATQRPLEEIARLLGGGEAGGGARGRKLAWKPRPVEIVDAGSRKALELFVEVPVEDMARLGGTEARPETRDEIRSGPAAAARLRRGRRRLDLAVDLSAPGRARARPPLDDDLRQQPPARRAARRLAERDRRRGDRPRPPRLGRAGEAPGDRGSAQARGAAGDRRDLVARARDRHGRRRPRRPDRGAAVDRVGHAADRPRGTHGRRAFARDPLSEVPGRPARGRGRDGADAGGQGRGDGLPAQPARRPRAADRGDRACRRRSASTTCTAWCAGPRPSPICRAPPSRACSTCSRAAIPRTSSRSSGRASRGTGSAAKSGRGRERATSRS